MKKGDKKLAKNSDAKAARFDKAPFFDSLGNEYSPSEDDRRRFARAYEVVLASKSEGIAGMAHEGSDAGGIGTYKEKSLHSVMKFFICDDRNCHEIKIFPETPDKSGARESFYIADVLSDCDIYEIQTGSLYPLENKLKFYLEETSYNVTVVCPLAARKWISWIDPLTSEVGKRSRSPKKEDGLDLLHKLFWLIPHLNNRRLTVRAPLLSIEEFRLKNGWGREGKRGSECFERIPTELLGVIDLSLPADYINLLPPSLPDTFTAKEFGIASRLKGRRIYDALKVFCGVGLIAPVGKSGRSVLYAKK